MKPIAKNDECPATPMDLVVEVAGATIHHNQMAAKEVATETRHSEGASRLSEMHHYQKEK